MHYIVLHDMTLHFFFLIDRAHTYFAILTLPTIPTYTYNNDIAYNITLQYIEDITRWREDMNFMFEWQQQYLTSERSERVRYCSCHENIKFISSSHRVMFFLLYGD